MLPPRGVWTAHLIRAKFGRAGNLPNVITHPRNLSKIVNTIFPNCLHGSSVLQFVSEFKYVGHFITNDL